MSDKYIRQYDLADRLAHEDMEAIADSNVQSFYELKRDLVKKRESLCSIEEIAGQLGEPVSKVAEFEQYYSDPTVSQLQEYALAVMCVIKVKVLDFHPDESSMYRHMTLPVDSSELLDIAHNARKSKVNIMPGQVSV